MRVQLLMLISLVALCRTDAFAEVPLRAAEILGEVAVVRYGLSNNITGSWEGVYTFQCTDEFYAARLTLPTALVFRKILIASDYNSIYQAERIKSFSETTDSKDSRTTGLFVDGAMPAGTPGWGAVQALAFAHLYLKMKSGKSEAFDIPIPEAIKLRALERKLGQPQYDSVSDASGNYKISFWSPGSDFASTVQEKKSHLIATIEFHNRGGAHIPEDLIFTNFRDTDILLAVTSFKGSPPAEIKETIFDDIAYDNDVSVAVSDKRHASGLPELYFLSPGDTVPFRVEVENPTIKHVRQQAALREKSIEIVEMKHAGVLLTMAFSAILWVALYNRMARLNKTKST